MPSVNHGLTGRRRYELDQLGDPRNHGRRLRTCGRPVECQRSMRRPRLVHAARYADQNDRKGGRRPPALQGRGRHRKRDQLRAAAAQRLEWPLHDGRGRRLRRLDSEPGARLRRRTRSARTRLCNGRHRHGPRQLDGRRQLGIEQRRATRELRPSRRPSHRRNRQSDHRALLRPCAGILVLRGLLARRRSGDDGDPTLSRRLRRARRRRTRL